MITFEKKIKWAFRLTVGLLWSLALGAAISARRIAAEKNDLVANHAEELILAQRLNSSMGAQLSAMPIYVLNGEPQLLAAFQRAHREFEATYLELAARSEDAAAREALRRSGEAERDLYARSGTVIQMREQHFTPQQIDAYLRRTHDPIRNSPNMLGELVRIESASFAAAKRADAQISDRIAWAFGLAALLAVMGGTAVAWLTIRETRRKTERDALEAELRAREQRVSNARKEAVESVAHDLRNPLFALRLRAEMTSLLLKRTVPDLPRVKASLDSLAKSSRGMEELVQNLLDHAKIEAGGLKLERADCDLRAVFAALLEESTVLARAKHVALECDWPASLPIAHCDAVRLRQVLANLLGNAIKFTPEGGEIRFRVERDAERARISVRDTGPGLAAADAVHVFDRYWQGAATASKGTGLGLSIARAIVEAHGGYIGVNGGIGAGSEFYCSIPLFVAPAPDHGLERRAVI